MADVVRFLHLFHALFRAAASTDCFLFDSGFWLVGVGIRLGGERHPDHNGGVPSSPLQSSKLTCRETPLAVVPLFPVPC